MRKSPQASRAKQVRQGMSKIISKIKKVAKK